MRVSIQQGGQEWLLFRQNKLGASEIAAALNQSKFMPKNLRELVEVKKGIRTVLYNAAMRAGNEFEGRARELAEQLFGEMFEPHTYVEDERGVLVASLDGISMNELIGIEIKVSDKTMEELLDQYHWQMQQQLLVSPITTNYLVAYRRATDTIEVSEPVAQHASSVEMILHAEQNFIREMEEYQPNELDPIAMQYAELNSQKLEIEAQMAKLKDELINKHKEGYKDETVTLYKTKGKTTTDYKKAINENLPELDLAKYQKISVESWSIKIADKS